MASLHPCESCHRHIKDTEQSCPFCGTAVSASFAPRDVPTKRLSRAALLALGTLAATPVACGGSDEGEDTEEMEPGDGDMAGDGDSGGDGDSMADVYGAPPVTGDGDGDSGGDGDQVAPVYGAPVGDGDGVPGAGGAAVYGAPPTNDNGNPSDNGNQ